MSLNMLVETGDGFDYTFDDFTKWAKHIGFYIDFDDAFGRSVERRDRITNN